VSNHVDSVQDKHHTLDTGTRHYCLALRTNSRTKTSPKTTPSRNYIA